MEQEKNDIQDNKVTAALSYISILFIVPLFLKRGSKFCQFHGKQGLIVFIMELLGFVPVIGWMLFVLALLLSIVGVLRTLDGKYWKLPVLGNFADKIDI